jgi:hypothetical protein
MRLFATMCNQPQRLREALAPVRSGLVAPLPIDRWGLGYVQSGEVLLARTPRPSATPIDMYATLEGIHSDCVIGQAVPDNGLDGTDNTPPFRYRRWMYVQDGTTAMAPGEPAWDGLAAQIPDYIRRNLRGRSSTEVAFHVLLAMLHDLGGIDDPNLATSVTRRAVAAASAMVASELTKAGVGPEKMPGNLAASNGRSLVVARIATPLWLRTLHVNTDRGDKDPAFRGVLLVSSAPGESGPPVVGDGFEEVPAGNVVSVSRDLRVDVAPLAA